MREAWVGDLIVDEGMTSDLSNEDGDGEDGHDGNRSQGLLDLQAHLILEVFGVIERVFVEDEQVGKGGEEEVDGSAEDPG